MTAPVAVADHLLLSSPYAPGVAELDGVDDLPRTGTVRIAVFGGAYSNPYALRALLNDARERGCRRVFCLGDLGGFGAEPEALWPLLVDGGVQCISGNYDVAIGRGDDDCGCGYRDRRDNEFAQVAYDYTRAHTSPAFAAWMRSLPPDHRETIGGVDLHMVHGSPMGVNDFFWESLSDNEVTERLEASGADVVLCTHSGLPWVKRVGRRTAVNVGVIGRPANDGRREVWYAVVDLADGHAEVELVDLHYDWAVQAASVRAAGLPEAFAETIETGWWTTCLQVLPPTERSRGRYQLYRSELAPGADDDGLGGPTADVAADGERPVVALFGTALFPRRLRVETDPMSHDRLLRLLAEAAAEGFREVRLAGAEAAATIERDNLVERQGDLVLILEALGGGDGAPAVTVTADGAYWPAHGPAVNRVAESGVALAEVKRRVVHGLLASGQADGSFPRAYGCVG